VHVHPARGAQPARAATAEFIFQAAPFASAHASTIAESRGTLVAAWFGGEFEGSPEVGIWLSRRAGSVWTAPREVANGVAADGTRQPCWNPVLFEPKGGPLMLFYKVGPNPREWWGMLRTSTDGGVTWSDARRLANGVLGPIKNKPVQLANGDFVSPSSTESTDTPPVWRVHFERSSDGGVTWSSVTSARRSPSAGEINAIQPAILSHAGGRLQAVGRTQSGRVFESWSADGGKTWSALGLTALPNPNSGLDAVTLRDGRQLVVYNHTASGRTPLNVAISRDGRAWDAALVLEREPGEYSYPAVIQTADGLVHVTYTWQRKRIKHVVIDPSLLAPREMPDGNWPAGMPGVAPVPAGVPAEPSPEAP
jgi:predicted neuraminidase